MDGRDRLDCRCAIFAQSRSLSYLTDDSWRDALFELLVERPVDTLYSIAFSIAFSPTFGVTSSSSSTYSEKKKDSVAADATTLERSRATFVASRELFDLLDDSIRDESSTLSSTAANDTNEGKLLDGRCVTLESFADANRTYATSCKEIEKFVESYLLSADEHRSSSSQVSDDVAVSAEFVGSSEKNEEILPDDRARMMRTFERLNEYSSLLPFALNAGCSRVSKRFDVGAIAESSSQCLLREPYDFSENDATVRSTAWTPAELFVRYAYTLARFDSFESVRENIRRERGVRLFPLLVPVGSVWQSGSSQLLWILLHTLCALSVARRNVYLSRLLVLLKNLSFFVWCGECKFHWRANLGDEYLALYSRLDEYARERFPIDIVLMRCHNTIAANGRLNRQLRAWTIAQLVMDYREFVDRSVLQRRPRLCNRVECLGRVENSSSTQRRRFGACFIRPYYMNERVAALAPADLLNVARGECLLTLLWLRTDSNVPIGAL